jgi:hypothetical protein
LFCGFAKIRGKNLVEILIGAWCHPWVISPEMSRYKYEDQTQNMVKKISALDEKFSLPNFFTNHKHEHNTSFSYMAMWLSF